MRVCVLTTFAHPDHFGGAERVVAEVARRLAARGHAVRLLTGRVAGTPERESREGLEILRFPMQTGRGSLRFYRSVWSGVRAALRTGVAADCDVLSLHQPLSGAAALVRGVPVPKARVLSFYAPYHLEYLARFREGRERGAVPLRARAVAGALRRVDRMLVRRCQRLLVLSRFSLAQVEDLVPGAGARTTIAPAGVDLARLRPGAVDGARRAELGLPDGDEPLLLTVRRLVPRMGVPDLLEASAALLRAGCVHRLAVAGTGEAEDALRAQAAALGLGERVRFLGRVPDDALPDLYRAADVFVLPTRSLEGFGMVTAEALASGLPVVATEAGASTEVLADVPGARLVPAGDAHALAEALGALLGDDAERARAASAARTHAERHLTWDAHLDAFERAAEAALRETGTLGAHDVPPAPQARPAPRTERPT
ncbi:MAG: glycosyltransferase family 4 protein [Planctomycetes bacterium]|nr:glycosyltransferase family 4 protein [Planctomycetota bacterium]